MANRGKVRHQVNTTVDRQVMFFGTIGLSGSVAASGVPQALSCSLVYSTLGGDVAQALNGQTTATPATTPWTGGIVQVSGTSPGLVTLTFDQQFSFPRMVAWGADLVPGQTSQLNFGGRDQAGKQHYILEKRAYQYPYGAQVPSSSATPLQTNSTVGGGSVMQFQITSLRANLSGAYDAVLGVPVSGVYADPIDASVASGSAVANITIWAAFRDTGRRNG